MEQLLHYVWKHKLFPLRELRTSDGQTVEVIDCRPELVRASGEREECEGE